MSGRHRRISAGAIQLRFAEQVGHADDTVERGAQFVAHAGQELALGVTGLLGLHPGDLQRFFSSLSLRDILSNAQEAHDLTVVIANRGH